MLSWIRSKTLKGAKISQSWKIRIGSRRMLVMWLKLVSSKAPIPIVSFEIPWIHLIPSQVECSQSPCRTIYHQGLPKVTSKEISDSDNIMQVRMWRLQILKLGIFSKRRATVTPKERTIFTLEKSRPYLWTINICARQSVSCRLIFVDFRFIALPYSF